MKLAEAMAIKALSGVGAEDLGQWLERGQKAVHIRRRLTEAEKILAGGLQVRDIRGTQEQRKRMALLLADAPQLRIFFK